MNKTKQFAALLFALIAIPLSLGCTPDVENDPVDTAQSNDEGDDKGQHPHHHELGPNKGHLIKLKPDDFVAEWTHGDKDHKVTVYILDKEGKESASIAADHVIIENATGKDAPISYELPADNLSDDDPSDNDPPTASRFVQENELLHTGLMMKGDVKSYLRFTIGDKQYEGEIEHSHHED